MLPLPGCVRRPIKAVFTECDYRLSCLTFSWAPLRANSCALRLPGLCFPGSSRKAQVPPIKHPLALGAAASRFWVPQENGARKRRKIQLSYGSSASSAQTRSSVKRGTATDRSSPCFPSRRSGPGRTPTTNGPRKLSGIASAFSSPGSPNTSQ
jgi:hypothetical protein